MNYMKRLLKKGMNTENHLVTPAPKETRRNRKNSESQGKENKENKENGEKKEGEVSGQPKKAWSEGSLGKPISSSGMSFISVFDIEKLETRFRFFRFSLRRNEYPFRVPQHFHTVLLL